MILFQKYFIHFLTDYIFFSISKIIYLENLSIITRIILYFFSGNKSIIKSIIKKLKNRKEIENNFNKNINPIQYDLFIP